MCNNTLQDFAYIYKVYMCEYLQLEAQDVRYASVCMCEKMQLEAQAVHYASIWVCKYLQAAYCVCWLTLLCGIDVWVNAARSTSCALC